MSGVFPLSTADSISLRGVSPSRVSVSHSQKRQVRSTGSHRWAIQMSFKNRSLSEYRQLEAFMDAQHGQAETFTIVVPATQQGSWVGAPVVDGASQTGFTLNLRGFTASQTGVVKAGDIFKTANIAKVYRAVADANSDAGGLVAVTLNAQLITSPADGEGIVHSDVPFTVSSNSDNVETAYAAAMIGSMSIDLIEVP